MGRALLKGFFLFSWGFLTFFIPGNYGNGCGQERTHQLILLCRPTLLGARPQATETAGRVVRSEERGIALVASNRWYNPRHVTMKDCLCNSDIELLASSLCSYYLPREFKYTIVITTYILPSAAPDVACDIINSVTANLQNQLPNASIIVTGNFNHGFLSTTLPSFYQFVIWPFRDN